LSNEVHLTSFEKLQAKDRYEDMCRDHGIIVQSYLSNNAAAFTSQEYTTKFSVLKQVMRFAGVGAHHHNSVAERPIGTIMTMARTIMLHAAIHWPESADATL
jgi:transposase InsO family protein